MVILFLGVGIYFTLRLRFIQIRKFKLSYKILLSRKEIGESSKDRRGDISPLQALTTSLAATIGNGNIAGVCTAIAMGGPGAVFWMWVSAFFGMATKLVEAMLGQKFKLSDKDGSVKGGPMYYIRDGLKQPWLAGTFAFFMGFKPLLSTTTVQSNSIALAVQTQIGISPWISGLGLAFLIWIVIIGGIKSIARVTQILSPFMVMLYFMGGTVTLILFSHKIPQAFSDIIVGAFHPSALAGGVAGMTVLRAMRYGLARGAYSNEAGTGTAAVFHATARTSEPARQGLIASLDVFIDTFVICTMTGLAVLVTGEWTTGTSTAMTAAAFNKAIPQVGGLIVAASSFLFGYSSLIAVPYYAETSFVFLFGHKVKLPFRWLFCGFVILGALMKVEVAWSIGDIFNGMMAFTNLIGLAGLSGLAVATVKEYLKNIRKWDKKQTLYGG